MELKLSEIRNSLMTVASNSFDLLTGIPQEKRPDSYRSGIMVYLQEPDTDNVLSFQIGSPSERARSFAYKKVFLMQFMGHAASQNSADPGKFRFPGALSVTHDGRTFQCGVSGLKSEEDVYVAARLLAEIFGITVSEVLINTTLYGGELPEPFSDHEHYLYRFV